MLNPFKRDELNKLDPATLFGAKRVIKSEELFRGERVVVIIHGESHYRLQITKAGKLILVK